MKTKKRKHSASPHSDLPDTLAAPARRALAGAGIARLEQLAKLTEAEVKQLHGIGPNAVEQLRRALRARRLSFARKEQKGAEMKIITSKVAPTASQLITSHITELADWRGKTLARLRKLILDAAPDIVEEWKWGTAVWSHHGNVAAVGAFKDHLKINFFKGASLKDSRGLFNAGLDAKATRAIDLREGDKIDEPALKELIRAAVAYNASSGKKK
jgi:hypothetical protein